MSTVQSSSSKAAHATARPEISNLPGSGELRRSVRSADEESGASVVNIATASTARRNETDPRLSGPATGKGAASVLDELDDSALSRAIDTLKIIGTPVLWAFRALSPASARSISRALGAAAFSLVSFAAAWSATEGYALLMAIAALGCGALLALREAMRRPAHRRTLAQRHSWRVERIAPETEQTALVAFALWMGGFAIWRLSPLATPETDTLTNAILLGGVAGALAVLVSGRIFSWLVSEAHRSGGVRERVLVIGELAASAKARSVLESEHPGHFKVVLSKLASTNIADDAGFSGRKLAELVRHRRIDLIVFASETPKEQDLNAVFALFGCADADVALLDTAAWRRGEPSLVRRIDRPTLAQRAWKRAVDILGAATLIVLLSPVLLGIAAIVALTSPGGVFFRQEREGKNGNTFRIFKFRTMYADKCDPDAKTQTVEGDKRVTPIGEFLRRTSLDEIPQLLNILMGDMSFIGPRPHAPGMLTAGMRSEEIVPGYARRQMVKPGLTGLAQVSGFRGPVYEAKMLQDRVAHDFEYIERFSWWLDLQIALKTPLTILRAENAR